MNLKTLNRSDRLDMLQADLDDVANWLDHRFPNNTVQHWVDFHYHQENIKEIAFVVTVSLSKTERRAVKSVITTALTALGWKVEYDCVADVQNAAPNPFRNTSGHAQLRSVGRVEAALHLKRFMGVLE